MSLLETVQNAGWNVAAIATGMKGATIGDALARRGFSVVFLEKGARVHELGHSRKLVDKY